MKHQNNQRRGNRPNKTQRRDHSQRPPRKFNREQP